MGPVTANDSGKVHVRARALLKASNSLAAAAMAAMLFAAGPAAACSLAPGYTAPTNLELAASAHAIVWAEVAGEAVIEAEASEDQRGIRLRPLQMVKGLPPQDSLVVPGMALSAEAPRDMSDPLELAAPHPDSYAGSCIRRTFAPGQRALMFLIREDGFWRPAGGAYSRWAEDVTDETAPWLALAQLYTHAARLPADQRQALLEDQEEALRARDDDVAQGMADDIARQLLGLQRRPLPVAGTVAEPVTIAETGPEPRPGSAPVTVSEGDSSAPKTSVEAALDAMRAQSTSRR